MTQSPAPSGVLGAFLAAVAAQVDAGTAEAVYREASRHFPTGLSERQLLVRLLTLSVRAMGDVVDRSKVTEPITTGDRAFEEVEALRSLRLDERRERPPA